MCEKFVPVPVTDNYLTYFYGTSIQNTVVGLGIIKKIRITINAHIVWTHPFLNITECLLTTLSTWFTHPAGNHHSHYLTLVYLPTTSVPVKVSTALFIMLLWALSFKSYNQNQLLNLLIRISRVVFMLVMHRNYIIIC